jgi:hypothetical protein
MRPRAVFQIWISCVFVFLVAAVTCAADKASRPTPAPQESLAAACEHAKADFHPITQADVVQAKTVLTEAIGRLDEKLTEAGAYGDGWRKYLHWELLQQSVRGDTKRDMDRLAQIYGLFTRGYDGLELAWFLDVQHALENYMAMANTVGSPQVRTAYERLLDKLAPTLDAYAAKPTTENALAISESVRWLQNAHQAPALVETIRERFVHPNVIGYASAGLVGAGVVDSVDDVTQINDFILGTSITGTAHTVGKTSATLAPNSDMGVIDTLFFGKTHSDNVGYHHPVTIFSTAETGLAGVKRVWITQNGLSSFPAASNAETHICIQDIQSRKDRGLVQRMAWKRAGKQQGEAECVASRHAEQRLNERIDEQAAEPLDKANQQYVEKYKQPFSDRNLFPQLLHFSTTERALGILGLQAGGGKVAAPDAPPPVVEGADMTLQLHESAINNLAFDALAGRTIYEEKVQATAKKVLGKLPEKLKGDQDGKPWTITFAAREPVTVTFADDGFKITINGVKFYKGEEYCDATTVWASYKIKKTPEGFKAIRQGIVNVAPAGERPDTGGRQTAIRSMLQGRFDKILEPEFVEKGIELSGRWKAAGKLMPIQIESRNGWLVIAWNRVPAGPKAATAKARAAKAAVTKHTVAKAAVAKVAAAK